MHRRLAMAVTCLALLGTSSPAGAQADAVRRDPRIELFSILFHLAGAPEYSSDKMPSYSKEVDEFFKGMRRHPAVGTTRQIRNKHNTGYFHPMNLAVNLTMPPELAERTPFDKAGHALGRRWPTEPTRSYLSEVRAFYREARVPEFLEKHAGLPEHAVKGLRDLLEREGDQKWLEQFFGAKASSFAVVPALLNGGAQYAAKYLDGAGVQEAYAIVGVYKVDAGGLPRFDTSDADNVVHEFTHTLADRAVTAALPLLTTAGPALYGRVAGKMREQAYGEWQTMVYEAVVRAIVVRFIAAHRGEEAARAEIAAQESLGFSMTRALVALLSEYEASRATYPTFDDLTPRLAATLEDLAKSPAP